MRRNGVVRFFLERSSRQDIEVPEWRRHMNDVAAGKSLLRVDEVARMFGVSKRVVYRRIDEGKLEALRVGRLLRIPSEGLRRRGQERREDGHAAP